MTQVASFPRGREPLLAQALLLPWLQASIWAHGVAHRTWGPRTWHLCANVPAVCSAVGDKLSHLHLTSMEWQHLVCSFPFSSRLKFLPDKYILKDPPCLPNFAPNYVRIVHWQTSIINNGRYFTKNIDITHFLKALYNIYQSRVNE